MALDHHHREQPHTHAEQPVAQLVVTPWTPPVPDVPFVHNNTVANEVARRWWPGAGDSFVSAPPAALLARPDRGHVAAVHIARSLDAVHGLDEQTVRSLEKWLFAPGFRDGEAVPVLITVQNSFTLGKNKHSPARCDR